MGSADLGSTTNLGSTTDYWVRVFYLIVFSFLKDLSLSGLSYVFAITDFLPRAGFFKFELLALSYNFLFLLPKSCRTWMDLRASASSCSLFVSSVFYEISQESFRHKTSSCAYLNGGSGRSKTIFSNSHPYSIFLIFNFSSELALSIHLFTIFSGCSSFETGGSRLYFLFFYK